MSLYAVITEGCDHRTLVVLPLTDAERDAVVKVSTLINETSAFRCMPTLIIRTATARDIADFNEKD